MSEVFPERLRELRRKKGLTQLQLSEKLGKAHSTVRMWELGKNQPSHETLICLARIFEVSVDYLLGQEQFIPPAAEAEGLAAYLTRRPALRELLAWGKRASDEELETALRIVKALKQG